MCIDLAPPTRCHGEEIVRPRGGISRYHPGHFAVALSRDGYASIAPADWGPPLADIGQPGWSSFAQSWDRLVEDRWMGDGGRYRRRRFAVFALEDGTVTRKPHQAHFQSRKHNSLNGGVARWFSPVETRISDHPITKALLRIGEEFANTLVGWAERAWHVELHQFRIDATRQTGKPSPEGLHRDGVTAVLMMLINRRNVRGGVTTLLEQGRFVTELELARPLEAIVLDDMRLQHSVSTVNAREKGAPAWRDMLVITFRPERYPASFPIEETSNGGSRPR
jgi:hypothetical protein